MACTRQGAEVRSLRDRSLRRALQVKAGVVRAASVPAIEMRLNALRRGLVAVLLASFSSCTENAFEEEVLTLEVGTPEAAVVKLLGSPTDSGSQFRLAQRSGFESQYRDAAESKSVRYLFWQKGVDFVCAVGLDAENRVAYRACGGS